MVTGWGMDLPKEVCERRGVTRLLSKPFDAKRLRRVLHEVLTRKS
jgi:CheY-like chemotaxis protein